MTIGPPSTAIAQRAAASTVVAEARLAKRIRRYPFFATVGSPSAPRSRIAGKEMLNLGSNNYLGLADDDGSSTPPSVPSGAGVQA